jgi:chorismate dehydratase
MANESNNQFTLGVVSFLNSVPLIEGLAENPQVDLHFAPPARLADKLRSGRVDAALIPVVDLANGPGREYPGIRWQRVSDACIAADGPTMTVRVFSRVPPEAVTTLHADVDSHTSVNLARLTWLHRFNRRINLEPLSDVDNLEDCETVLLIGDKVVTTPTHDFEYDIDLGQAWKEWTGLPFVFAVWTAPEDRDHQRLGELLNQARDRGVERAVELAAEQGPRHGWPVELAEEYLTQRMKYHLTDPALKGMLRFANLAATEGFIAASEAMR